MKINLVLFPKTVQVMVVICCLGLGCSVPKNVQIEDTTPAVAADKQSDKSTEVQYDESKMDLVKESQKEKGPAEIREPVKQYKKPIKATQAPVAKAEPKKVTEEIKQKFKEEINSPKLRSTKGAIEDMVRFLRDELGLDVNMGGKGRGLIGVLRALGPTAGGGG